MMETVVTVALDILIIAGALCVLLLVVILWHVLGLVMKAKEMVAQTQRTYNQMSMLVLEPFRFIASWLGHHLSVDDDDDDLEIELPKKKKKKKML